MAMKWQRSRVFGYQGHGCKEVKVNSVVNIKGMEWSMLYIYIYIYISIYIYIYICKYHVFRVKVTGLK